jgi:Domain of unknown function (DUF4157)
MRIQHAYALRLHFRRAESYALGQMKSHEHQHVEHDEVGRRAEAVPETDTANVERLAAAVGNQAFGVIARAQEGAGILPDGTAHPDVAAAIARRRGYGEPLEQGIRDEFAGKLGDAFHDVRVHNDGEADAIARSVSANAFTTGADVYFAAGQYKPESQEGKELIAHELAHVVQQRGASASGPLSVSQPGDSMEREADSVADRIG